MKKTLSFALLLAFVLPLTVSCIFDGGDDPDLPPRAPAPAGYVDLGLDVYWAQSNLGAPSPTAYGDFYAWGETQTKEKYTWKYYTLCDGMSSNSLMTKYCTHSDQGFVDGLVTLLPTDDAACRKLNGSARMPSAEEWDDLLYYCDWKWQNSYEGSGVAGYLVTSTIKGFTNNSIFLPAAGMIQNDQHFRDNVFGYYWSSTLDFDSSNMAYYLSFERMYLDISSYGRCYGFAIRPVKDIN